MFNFSDRNVMDFSRNFDGETWLSLKFPVFQVVFWAGVAVCGVN